MIEKQTAFYYSSIDLLQIIGNEGGIESVSFDEHAAPTSTIHNCLKERVNQLDEYFQGRRKGLTLKRDLSTTTLQERVWREPAKIPYAKTFSHRDIECAIGSSQAFRAFGSANGQNSISIIILCHRDVARDDSPMGYGGGLRRKEWLFDSKRSLPQPNIVQSALALGK